MRDKHILHNGQSDYLQNHNKYMKIIKNLKLILAGETIYIKNGGTEWKNY